MNAGLIILRIASERRDAQNERDGAAAQFRRSSSSVAAAPSQQLWRSSSVAAALQPIGAAAAGDGSVPR